MTATTTSPFHPFDARIDLAAGTLTLRCLACPAHGVYSLSSPYYDVTDVANDLVWAFRQHSVQPTTEGA